MVAGMIVRAGSVRFEIDRARPLWRSCIRRRHTTGGSASSPARSAIMVPATGKRDEEARRQRRFSALLSWIAGMIDALNITES